MSQTTAAGARTATLTIPGVVEAMRTGVLASCQSPNGGAVYFSRDAGWWIDGSPSQKFIAEAQAVIVGYLASVRINARAALAKTGGAK